MDYLSKEEGVSVMGAPSFNIINTGINILNLDINI